MSELLARDNFREQVLKRDNYTCVFCNKLAKNAHHIMERKLFSDGGYYLDNGVSVCEEHHILCEKTIISCEEIRDKAKIGSIILPDHLKDYQLYDKWGNPILPNGQRLRGELLNKPSVQAILADVISLFTCKVKYPRTYHFPWSPNLINDDRMLESLDGFVGKEVVITQKMDGENTSMYRDNLHARSIEYENHITRDLVKAIHGRIKSDIPEDWRICGENCYAKHSIKYDNLPGYFLVFSVWNEKNECLSWDDTLEWAALLDLQTVPKMFRTTWSDDLIEKLKNYTFDNDKIEGYVVRITDKFHYKDFRKVVGKYVRKNHVQTDEHWKQQKIEVNKVK